MCNHGSGRFKNNLDFPGFESRFGRNPGFGKSGIPILPGSGESTPMPGHRPGGFRGLVVCVWVTTSQTTKSPMPGHRGLFSRSRPNRDSRFPESRDPDQTGIPDSPNPGIPTKPGFKSGKIPIFFAAARAVIKKTCQRQARLVRFLIGVPGWEKRLIVH